MCESMSIGVQTLFNITLFKVGMMCNGDDDDNFSHLMRHSTFTKGTFPKLTAQNLYRCQDNVTRDTFKQALTGAFSESLVMFTTVTVIP